jgi:ribosomal-protein-alanine N-acetyltransferase
MSIDFFLEGENIYLRSLNSNDVDGNYSLWLNDPEITAFNSHGRFPMTKEKLSGYIEHSRSSKNDLILAVVDKISLKHIGNISLQNISWLDRNAEIAFLLGDKAFSGKGIMYEAGILLINHGFKTLNLHRIYCGTSSENSGMQKLAVKLKMKKEGLRKEAIFKQGQYYDIVEYGILATDI